MNKLLWIVESLEHRDVPSTVSGNLWPTKVTPISATLIGDFATPNNEVYPPDDDGPVAPPPPPPSDGDLIGGPIIKPIPDPWSPPVG
jgi:hypothetical protein